jgi:hypothetical protein
MSLPQPHLQGDPIEHLPQDPSTRHPFSSAMKLCQIPEIQVVAFPYQQVTQRRV